MEPSPGWGITRDRLVAPETVSDIERIEVLRSPGTTVFGSDSARGVISIVTKSGSKNKPPRVTVSSSFGSWDTLDSYANLSGGMNNWDYYVNASYLDTDGYIHDDQTRHGLRMKGGYSFSDNHRLGLNLGHANNDYETARGKTCTLWTTTGGPTSSTNRPAATSSPTTKTNRNPSATPWTTM